MSKQLSLAVTPSINLRKSQARLYEFILNKHKASETISLPEVIEQYSSYGNRMVHGGKPYCYLYDWKEHRDNMVLLQGDQLKVYAVQWFIRNLGILVVKGLLTAIPTMELSEIHIEEEML